METNSFFFGSVLERIVGDNVENVSVYVLLTQKDIQREKKSLEPTQKFPLFNELFERNRKFINYIEASEKSIATQVSLEISLQARYIFHFHGDYFQVIKTDFIYCHKQKELIVFNIVLKHN
jgi:hypothetical protein